MTFWELFFRALPYRPGQALAASYWHITRRRVRAKNRISVASADLPFAYAFWIRDNESTPELADSASRIIESWSWQPRFTVMLHDETGSAPGEIERSLRSVAEQIYPAHTLVKDTADPIGRAIGTDGDYLMPLRVGDALSPNALFHLGQAIQANRNLAIVYGDQDELDETGRRSRPWFKPRWNREMFLAQDYLSSAMAIDMALARQ